MEMNESALESSVNAMHYTKVLPNNGIGASVAGHDTNERMGGGEEAIRGRYTSLPSILLKCDPSDPLNDPVPDPYQWIVVLACFLNFFIVDGIGNSMSLFYVAFCRDLDYGRSQLSWVMSIHYSMTLISGPVASVMVDAIGCGKTTMLGAILTFVGFAASSYTNQLSILIVMIGFVTGLGVCLVYMASYTCVALYFTGQKAVATGLFSCGSGVGALVLGPLTNYLIDKYLWHGATLIYSSLFLNLLVTGCLMLRSNALTNHKAPPPGEPIKNKNGAKKISTQYRLVENVTCPQCYENRPIVAHSASNIRSVSLHDISTGFRDYSEKQLHLKCMACTRRDMWVEHPESRHDFISKQNVEFSKLFGNYTNQLKAIFSNVDYTLFFISNLILYASGDTPCLFFIDRVISLGIVKNSGILVSIMGVSNTIGHLFFGFLSEYGASVWDQNATIYIYTVSIIVSGIATTTVPAILDYYSSVIFTILLGFFISANYTLTSIITLDIVGDGLFTTAFGCILTSQGIGALIGAPIGGALIDKFHNFDMAFYLAGVVIILSGIIISFRPLLSYVKTKKAFSFT